jgi:hypothetical protein
LFDQVGPHRFFHKIRDALDSLRDEDRVLDLLTGARTHEPLISGLGPSSGNVLGGGGLLGSGLGPSLSLQPGSGSLLNPVEEEGNVWSTDDLRADIGVSRM